MRKYLLSTGLALVLSVPVCGSLMLEIKSFEPLGVVRDEVITLRAQLGGIPVSAEMFVDGEPLQTELDWSEGALARAELEEGSHQVEVQVSTPFATCRETFTVKVDRTAPTFKGSQFPSVVAATDLDLEATTEPGAEVYLKEERLAIADEKGQLRLSLPLQPGANELDLSVRDAADNREQVKLEVFSDQEPPSCQVEPADGARVKENKPFLKVVVSDDHQVAGLKATLNDQPLKVKSFGQGHFVLVVPELHEGQHRLDLTATDQVGRERQRESWFLVDSTDEFGKNVIGEGAVGKDVRILQRRLIEAKYLKPDEVTGVFDRPTKRAVMEVQKSLKKEPTGIADESVLIALGPRIFINQSRFSLVLDRPGKEPIRYSIATGSSAYPTPVGDFIIKEKVMHPTWLPPKSPWAANAKPIPPGPANPLGTRWLGFNWGGVGIHGTNAPWSIGSAASHGCIRMRVPEVEALYELVQVGTPVTVFGGWEKDPMLDKYWAPPKAPQ